MSSSYETSAQTKKQDKQLAPSPKKPWTDPKFSRYGSVAELTAGGSGIDTENKGKDPQPDKMP